MEERGEGGGRGERAWYLGHLATGAIDRANCKMTVTAVSVLYVVCCTGHGRVHVEVGSAKREDVGRGGGECCRLQEEEDKKERDDKEVGHVCTLLGQESIRLRSSRLFWLMAAAAGVANPSNLQHPEIRNLHQAVTNTHARHIIIRGRWHAEQV